MKIVLNINELFWVNILGIKVLKNIFKERNRCRIFDLLDYEAFLLIVYKFEDDNKS